MNKEQREQIGRLERCRRTWEDKSYCDKNGLCEFCQKQVSRINKYITKIKK